MKSLCFSLKACYSILFPAIYFDNKDPDAIIQFKQILTFEFTHCFDANRDITVKQSIIETAQSFFLCVSFLF